MSIDITALANRSREQDLDPAHRASRLALLDKLAACWAPGATPAPPGRTDSYSLSINEWVALCIATKHDSQFEQPVAQFVSVQPWLQSWALKRLRLPQYIGRTLGEPDQPVG